MSGVFVFRFDQVVGAFFYDMPTLSYHVNVLKLFICTYVMIWRSVNDDYDLRHIYSVSSDELILILQ